MFTGRLNAFKFSAKLIVSNSKATNETEVDLFFF